MISEVPICTVEEWASNQNAARISTTVQSEYTMSHVTTLYMKPATLKFLGVWRNTRNRTVSTEFPLVKSSSRQQPKEVGAALQLSSWCISLAKENWRAFGEWLSSESNIVILEVGNDDHHEYKMNKYTVQHSNFQHWNSHRRHHQMFFFTITII